MGNMFHGMFGKIAPGMCRLSMTGEVAVKTDNGYKSYNVSTKRLTNCDNFVFHAGEEFFFLIPTKKVREGDIILTGGKPKCVIAVEGEKITVINYEDSTVDLMIPEHHVFMGDIYFYEKIVSVFGNHASKKKKGGNKIMKYMMMKELLKGNSPGSENAMSSLLPLVMMSGGDMNDFFGDIFDLEEEE